MPGGDESIALGRRLQIEIESTCGGSSEGRRVATHRASSLISWIKKCHKKIIMIIMLIIIVYICRVASMLHKNSN